MVVRSVLYHSKVWTLTNMIANVSKLQKLIFTCTGGVKRNKEES